MRVLFELWCALNFGEYVNNVCFLSRAHAKKFALFDGKWRRKITLTDYSMDPISVYNSDGLVIFRRIFAEYSVGSPDF